MDYKIKIIRHSDIDEKTVLHIIALKRQHWNYSCDSQLNWLSTHLSGNDTHVCMGSNDHLIAYMNAVELKIIADGETGSACGIGNICVDRSHSKMGWGLSLLSFYHCILKESGRKGILLCRDELVDYYNKCNWKPIDKSVAIFIAEKRFLLNSMIINWNIAPQKSLFIDKMF